MIGILGGTFDPIHFGHLRTALDVMQATGLDEMRFIPLHRAVHRAQPQTDGSLRLRMVQAAIADQPGFLADDRELRRRGDSYMVETLASLHAEFPGQPLCLVLGMDAFDGFADWRQPDEILRLAHLIVMHRPGEPGPRDHRVQGVLEAHRCAGSEALAQAPAGCIWLQAVTQLDISATRIRTLVAAGESPRYLLPEAVLALIESHDLYRGR